jgi:hypothetical protein
MIYKLQVDEQFWTGYIKYLFILIISVSSFPRVSGGSSTTEDNPFSFFILSNLIVWSTDVKLQ